jgi:hypothetical protein
MQSSRRLVALIEHSADELTQHWLRIVRSDPNLPSYHTYDEKILYERIYNVYSQLGKWISRETSKDEIAAIYRALGSRRRQEGFSLSEVILALIMSRRVLAAKIQEEGILDSGMDVHIAQGLRNRIAQFFDRATYFIINGYEKNEQAASAQ